MNQPRHAKDAIGALEAMQERTVTSGNTTHELETPFLVMATQNRSKWKALPAA